MKNTHLFACAIAAALTISNVSPVRAADDAADATGTPQVFLDKNPRIVAYQLKRLSNAQLIAFERKTDDPKYKPVYEALLARKGIEKKYREEAVEALAKLGSSDPVSVLLEAIGKTEAEDKTTPRELASLLMAQKPATLAAQKENRASLGKESEYASVKHAAYAGVVTLVEKAARAERTSPAIVPPVQLGNDLAGARAPDKAAPIRKSLRELAVRVVVLHTLNEQMMYDLHYFTVQAGKPVQIILDNTDNMPPNVVITAPGAFQEIALTAGGGAASRVRQSAEGVHETYSRGRACPCGQRRLCAVRR